MNNVSTMSVRRKRYCLNDTTDVSIRELSLYHKETFLYSNVYGTITNETNKEIIEVY